MEIALARPDEHDAIAALNVAAYAEYRAATGEARWAVMRANLSAVAEVARAADFLVARAADGTLVGSAAYYRAGTSIPPLPRECASVRMVAVAPEARGRGVGEALMRACVARARDEGAPAICLYTTEMMAAARALYDRLGFVQDADLPERHGHACWRYTLHLT